MPKLIGSLFIGVLLLIACGQALSQSIPPSRANSPPSVTPYLHIISCYDMMTGNLLDCRVFDELVGVVPPPDDLINSGFHQQHVGSHPLVDLSTGASGFFCLLCTDLNPNPLIIQANTNSSYAVIRHSIPQFAGRIQVNVSIIPPPGWSCLTDCNFDFVEEVGVDGLSELPFPGPNLSYQNSRAPNDTRHPKGSSGTSDTLTGIAAIAQSYLDKKGAGLRINDLSLPRGGKFDLGGAYQESDAHVSHRTGKDVDIGHIDLAGKSTNCFAGKDMQQILAENGVGRVRLCETMPGGAYHVRFK